MKGLQPDLRSFIDTLVSEGDLTVVSAEVDPSLEIPEIHRRVIAANGPALLFENVRGSGYPVVTNLFGTRRRVELAFGSRPCDVVKEIARLPEEMLPPSLGRIWKKRSLISSLFRVGMKSRSSGPVTQHHHGAPDLTSLPALKSWHEDGGPFITLPLVYTEHPGTRQGNLGVYRMQIFDERHAGMHFQIAKGAGFHLSEAERSGEDLPAAVFLGGPPALILAAVAPLPENIPEMLFASLVMGSRMPMVRHADSPLRIPANAEFALLGDIPAGERRPEGPFGDHYGYYSLKHDYPVFRCRSMLSRKDAIFPATVVGKPRQEDFYIGDFLQELLSPLFPLVMPGVRDLWSYGETGYHSLSAAVVRDRYRREAMVSAFRILGEGQLSLTKFLIVTDSDIDLRDFRSTLEHVLQRCDMQTDLYVFSNLSMDTLDYTGPKVNEGSKGVLLGLGEPVRELPREIPSQLPSGIGRAEVFCGGCLVLEATYRSDHKSEPNLAARVAGAPELAQWPLVVLVDDARQATRSQINFLWVTFTRFEPAADLYTGEDRIVRNHRVFSNPVVIDARKKENYPAELFADEATAARVSGRWGEYFPGGMEMGDSDAAHLD